MAETACSCGGISDGGGHSREEEVWTPSERDKSHVKSAKNSPSSISTKGAQLRSNMMVEGDINEMSSSGCAGGPGVAADEDDRAAVCACWMSG